MMESQVGALVSVVAPENTLRDEKVICQSDNELTRGATR